MKKLLLSVTILSVLIACISEKKENQLNEKVLIAKKIPKKLTTHDDTRIDNYFWMRLTDEQKNAESPDQQTKDVLDYLNQENEYLKSAMSHTEEFQEKLYNEIVGRIKKDDQSVPINENGYSYYSRYEEDDDYPLYCRKKIDGDGMEEIMLDGPEMAKGYS